MGRPANPDAANILIYSTHTRKDRIREYCKANNVPRVSPWINSLIDKELDAWEKGVGTSQQPVFDLKVAEEREVKLANEDTDLEKKLGGRKSSLYRALCRLAAANGLTQNYQNKDQVILALMEYQIQPHDLFTQNDLTRFRRKIQVMAELRTLRPQIVEAKKTRGDVMSLGTIATQVTASH